MTYAMGSLTLPRYMVDFRLIFLGTGTSQGVPVIGCECHVCTSPDPRDWRSRSSIYIATPEMSWVVDTGPDFRTQCLREKLKTLDAVVMTHSHSDHIMGFDDLRPFFTECKLAPVYGSAETLADLARVFQFAFNGLNQYPGYLHPVPRIVDGPFVLGETTITPLPVPHGKTTTFGYLFERRGEKLVAYLSDCKAVPDEVAARISGVRHLIVDALRHKPHPTHMSFEEALEVSTRVRPTHTWFTHLTHEVRHAEFEPTLPDGVRIAYDGLVLDVEPR